MSSNNDKLWNELRDSGSFTVGSFCVGTFSLSLLLTFKSLICSSLLRVLLGSLSSVSLSPWSAMPLSLHKSLLAIFCFETLFLWLLLWLSCSTGVILFSEIRSCVVKGEFWQEFWAGSSGQSETYNKIPMLQISRYLIYF
jgi:hypothetical protein